MTITTLAWNYTLSISQTSHASFELSTLLSWPTHDIQQCFSDRIFIEPLIGKLVAGSFGTLLEKSGATTFAWQATSCSSTFVWFYTNIQTLLELAFALYVGWPSKYDSHHSEKIPLSSVWLCRKLTLLQTYIFDLHIPSEYINFAKLFSWLWQYFIIWKGLCLCQFAIQLLCELKSCTSNITIGPEQLANFRKSYLHVITLEFII